MGRHKPNVSKPTDPGEWWTYRHDSEHLIRENRIFIECWMTISELRRCGMWRMFGLLRPGELHFWHPSLNVPRIGDRWMAYHNDTMESANYDILIAIRFRIPRKASVFYRELREETRLPRLINAAIGFQDTDYLVTADWLEEHGFSLSVMYMRFAYAVNNARGPLFIKYQLTEMAVPEYDMSEAKNIPRTYFGR